MHLLNLLRSFYLSLQLLQNALNRFDVEQFCQSKQARNPQKLNGSILEVTTHQLGWDDADEIDDEPSMYVVLGDLLELHDIGLVKWMLVSLEPAEYEIKVEEPLDEPE